MKINGWLILLFTALLLGLSQVELSLGKWLPITGQTIGVILCGVFLSPRTSWIPVGIYLALGILGAPVFSEARSGWDHFTGSSFGYFIGFLLAPFSMFLFFRLLHLRKNFITLSLAAFDAHLVILIAGSMGLLRWLSFEEAISKGLLPFLLPGAAKSLIIGGLAYFFISKRRS